MNCTTERIGRLVKSFEEDNEAYFIVSNAPTTEVQLITGEIGKASFFINEMYYGLPCIKYSTRDGDVTLFPDEVIPAPAEEIAACLNEGGKITKDGRYLPNKDIVRDIYESFGSRVGF